MPADIYGAGGAGVAFRDYLKRAAPAAFADAVHAVAPASRGAEIMAPLARDFLVGAITGQAPAGPPQPKSVLDLVGAPARAARFREQMLAREPAQAPQQAQAAAKATQGGDPRLPVGAPSFDQMLAAYAKGNGGAISLREMSALADIAAKTATRQRLPGIADIAGQQALQLGDQLFNTKIDQAKKSNDKAAYLQAIEEHQDRLERLARARAIDPLSAYGFDEGQ